MKIPSRSRFTAFVRLAALTLLLELGARAPMLAQDNATAGEPIVATIDPAKLIFDFLVDGRLAQDDPANRKFKTLQAAYAAAPAGTPEKPTVIGIAPNVYQIPAAAGATTGLTITKNYLTLLGLTNNRRSVVFADNRGNRMGGGESGGSSNGYVIMVNATGFTARNVTFLNYCNVDYEYPDDPSKNLKKRSETITQAVALDAVGDKHHYENVAFCSRLDTTFIRTTRSYFKNVFIEGTDDFIGGGQIGVWEDCVILFPTGSGVCAAGGITFINCKFTATRGMQFSKGAGRGVALINCTLPANTAWVRAQAPPRPNLFYLTYHAKDAEGKRARVSDGSSGPHEFTYSRELSEVEVLAFNPWNLLRAAPNGTVDDWDPAGTRATYEAAGQGNLVFRLALTGQPAAVRTGGAGATIGVSVLPARADQTITWSTDSRLINLNRSTGPSVVVTGKNPGLPAFVPVSAIATNGFRCTAWVFVEPAYVAPPILARGPTLRAPASGKISVDYSYDLARREDQSLITWSICDDSTGAHPREVAVSRGNLPHKTYTLTPGEVGKFLKVGVQPKHSISDPGPEVFVVATRPVAAVDVKSATISPEFRNFVTTTNPTYENGRWTLLGAWTAVDGENFVNGYGIRAASQGAQLLYQNDAKTASMRLEITMTPEKTEGMGFGSPGGPQDGDRVQKSDIYLKYDPRTKNGYALRYWRTTAVAHKCVYQLYRIVNGAGSPINEQQIVSGVFKPTTRLTMAIIGDQFTVKARHDGSGETLSLEGTVAPNDFGGAGVAWYGTTQRGNSNVYSQFEISYPATAP